MSIELERVRANAMNALFLKKQDKNYAYNAKQFMKKLIAEESRLVEEKKLIEGKLREREDQLNAKITNELVIKRDFCYTIEDEQTKMDYLQRKQMNQMPQIPQIHQMQQMQQMPQNPQVPSIQQQNPIYTTQDGMIILSTLANGEWIVLKTFDKSDKKQKTKKAQRWIKLTPQFGAVFMSQYGLYVLETPTTSGVSEFAYLYLCI